MASVKVCHSFTFLTHGTVKDRLNGQCYGALKSSWDPHAMSRKTGSTVSGLPSYLSYLLWCTCMHRLLLTVRLSSFFRCRKPVCKAGRTSSTHLIAQWRPSREDCEHGARNPTGHKPVAALCCTQQAHVPDGRASAEGPLLPHVRSSSHLAAAAPIAHRQAELHQDVEGSMIKPEDSCWLW